MDGMKQEYSTQDIAGLTRQIGRADPNVVLADTLGKPFIDYRRKWEAAGRLECVPDYPLEIGFDLLFACNLRCAGCYFSDDTPKPSYLSAPRPFPLDAFKKVIEEGANNGLGSVYFGYASEPTMNRQYLDYVEAASRAGISDIWFGTNGILLDETSIDRLLEQGVTRLVVSIDAATRETFEKVRIRGDYDRLMRNMNYLLEAKERKKSVLPLIRVSFVANQINQHEVEDFKAFWQEKVDYMSIQKFCAMEDFTDSLYPDGKIPKLPEDFACPQPFQRLFINDNGDVYPCCSFENMYSRELRMGNIEQMSIGEIWKSEPMQKLREAHLTGTFSSYKACTTCALCNNSDSPV